MTSAYHPHQIEEDEFGRGPLLWDADPDVCCAAFQLGACVHTEVGDYDTDDTTDEAVTTYTAKFVKASHADSFAERVTSDTGYGCTNVQHRQGRRVVTFDGPDTAEFRECIAENIGYFGSPPLGPVATLNGVPTPRSY